MNKRFLPMLSLAAIFLFLQCTEKKNVPEGQPVSHPQAKSFNLAEYRKEGMPTDSVTINGTLPFLMRLEQCRQLLGAPDSVIVAPNVIRISQIIEDTIPGKYYYHFYGKSIFISKGNYIHPYMIDFESTPLSIVYKGYVFKYGDNVDVLKQLFPNSSMLYKGAVGNGFWGTVLVNGDKENHGINLWIFKISGDRLLRLTLTSTR